MQFLFNIKQVEGKYNSLKPVHLLSTLRSLETRIEERFPESGLSQVAAEMGVLSKQVVQLCEQLKQPIWLIRIASWLAIAGLVGLSGWLLYLSVQMMPAEKTDLSELAQGSEAAINELIFLALSIFFLATLETRLKRKAALDSLHRLRSMAHVVDMHQLTKDPAYLLSNHQPTAASPKRSMSAFELTRYLDYCSELLAIISKLAALHVQDLQDAQVLDTVNDVENLSHGLSSKIWQKIMVIDSMLPMMQPERKA